MEDSIMAKLVINGKEQSQKATERVGACLASPLAKATQQAAKKLLAGGVYDQLQSHPDAVVVYTEDTKTITTTGKGAAAAIVFAAESKLEWANPRGRKPKQANDNESNIALSL